ncbi:response regulator transcription factor [Mucilaginibacter terrae]|uniref:DNA-binding CsgD family transcriptional regulator n=1 Tax=Mucilaginibacter terrae TaxID=1955052 RepID=A0ABU3H084_9SPHI|nr:helix-turn-helix transcriptional regulator [Mucilaginibacter terrae]MDT3405424.1 DNA-binding CsgD family transcriptional regulator [Mucilaginibacter terrae]
MKDKTQSSLLTRSKVNKPETDHTQQQLYLEAVKAFARLTYESVYVINYEDMSFEYVSQNPLFLCGYTADEVLAMGYDFYFKNVTEPDLQLLTVINNAGFDFYDKLPPADRKLYSISYDFHLVNKDGNRTLVNHKLTPLFLTADQKIWKSMCIVSISHYQTAGNVFIHKQGSDNTWQLDLTTGLWRKNSKPKLSQRETEILRLHAQGLTINQIAEKIFIAPDTVKYHRRRIFEQLNVKNMVEALGYAVSSRII